MTDAIETAKRRYSSELAAYTLEQWRIAHQKMKAASEAKGNTNEGGKRSPSPDNRSRTSRPASSLLAADLMSKPLPAINGTA